MKMTFRNKKHGFALVVFLTLAAAAGVMIGYQYSTSAQTEVLTTRSPEIQAFVGLKFAQLSDRFMPLSLSKSTTFPVV